MSTKSQPRAVQRPAGTKSQRRNVKLTQPETPTTGNAWPHWPWFFVGIILICTIAVRTRLLPLYLERDEGEFAYGGQLMLEGIPPYKYLYAMKLPGIYAAYAVVMTLFGQTAIGIHLGLMLVNAVSIVLMFLIGRRLLDAYAGVVAAASYAVLSTSTAVLGFAGHATQYVVVFALAGIFVLLRALDRGTWAVPELALSGLLFGLSILMKQSGFFYGLFAALWILWIETRRKSVDFRRLLARLCGFGACISLPLLITWVLLAAAGVYKRSIFWNFIYASAYAHEAIDLGRETGNPVMFIWHGFLKCFTPVCLPEIGLWIMGGLGLIALLWRGVPNRLFLGGFVLFAAVAVMPGFYFRPHYFVQFLPAEALLVGVLCWTMTKAMRDQASARWIAGLAFAAVVAFTVVSQEGTYFQNSIFEISRFEYGCTPFPEAVPIADYIRANSSPLDRIAILGSEPEIFFYAHRLSATGHIYMNPLMEQQKYAGAMQLEAIRELNASHAKFLLLETNDGAWSQMQRSVRTILLWARATVGQYRTVGVADVVYRTQLRMLWGEDALDFRPVPGENFILIMRRID
ncbi:MAG: ArnT family glycosyltransferase [Capsulimonadaceae bacterium]